MGKLLYKIKLQFADVEIDIQGDRSFVETYFDEFKEEFLLITKKRRSAEELATEKTETLVEKESEPEVESDSG